MSISRLKASIGLQLHSLHLVLLLMTSPMKSLQIRLPAQLRDEADSVLSSMGIDLPTAVRLYLKKIVQTRSIPFSVEASHVEPIAVDAKTQARMDSVARSWSAKQR